ncbi:MAG: chemotaxis protein CheA, partial [Planctomycetota bacterium]
MADDLSGFSLLELFRLEAEGQTAALSAGVLAIEQLDASPQTLESMMRAAHSLKGAARIVGLEPAVQVAHALEDVFVAASRGTLRVRPEHADVLLSAIDFLGSIALADDALSDAGPWPTRAAEVVARLASLPAADAPPAPAPPLPSPPPEPTARGAEAPPPPAQPTEPASEAEPATTAPRGLDPTDRVVRVSADSLNRLVGLAGEALVETRQMRPFVDALLQFRSAQVDLCDALAALDEKLEAGELPSVNAVAATVAALRRRADGGLATLARHVDDFESFARRNEDLSNRLHHEVIASRMRPLADGIRGFPRLVRDLARTLGKEIRFEVVGEQTGVDRDILDKLEAPLSHLIRNAVDHGLETPAERLAAGKPASGTIRLEARHRAGMLHITLADDGRGIDVERLRERAVAKGLVARAVAERLGELELLEFLFLPGFTTSERVTEISGRGVGLDVVQSMVK